MSTDFKQWKRAQKCIAQGALTNSKHPDSHVYGVYPTHASGGQGSLLFAEGKPYVDYICALGANFLGYANPIIHEALVEEMQKGFSHSLPTTYELDTAEKLKEVFFFIDKWKFLKSGTQACAAAIKIARTYTGRENVLSQGYHGHSDEFVSLTAPALGVHECKNIAQLNSEDMFETFEAETVAAVIVEPVMTDASEERINWLRQLRKKCDTHGILLIFDEVITGFRYKKFSVSQAHAIFPDLLVIGKAMANGLPLAAVGGRSKVMDTPYFVSSTYAGEILSMVATKKVCDLLVSSSSYRLDKLWEEGERFMAKFNEMGEGRIAIEGYPTRGVFKAEAKIKALFFQEAVKSGFLFCNSWFYNFGLVAYDFSFFSFFKSFMDRLKLGKLKLEGAMPVSPFSQKVRENGKS